MSIRPVSWHAAGAPLLVVPLLAALLLTPAGCARPARHDDYVFATSATPSLTLDGRVVETGCALCMFGREDPGACETAILVDGTVFMAKGRDVPDAEDHATGVCRSIRKARVSGRTEGSDFIATSFELLP